MIRTATSLLILAALAGTASAEEIRVSLAGKSPQAIHAEIKAAAVTVCRRAYGEARVGMDEMSGCIRAAVSDAEAQVRTAMASSAPVSLASAETAPRR
jgi:hypothetical protein